VYEKYKKYLFFVFLLCLQCIEIMPPRVFIIASHGSMPMEEDKSLLSLPVMGQAKFKRAAKFKSPVDMFTTASFGCSFVSDLRCDEPFVDFVRELDRHRLAMKTQSTQPTHPQLRELIKHTLVHTRDLPQHADVRTQAENKIRCHKKGRWMTDLFLFGTNPALPVIESVTMYDMETGELKDVHREFGLVKKKKIAATRAMRPHQPDHVAMLEAAKMSAESDPFFIEMKASRVQSIDDTIACMHKESKFEYPAKMKKSNGRIKLSDLLHNGIKEIDPDNDFVVIYACRVPDEGLLGAQTSPRDSSDSEKSVGGTRSNKKQNQKQNQRHIHQHRRKTCKRRS
jgi:hypothetical protein